MTPSAGLPPVFVTVSVTSIHCPSTTVPDISGADEIKNAGAVTVTALDPSGPVLTKEPSRASVPVTVAENNTVPAEVASYTQVRLADAPPRSVTETGDDTSTTAPVPVTSNCSEPVRAFAGTWPVFVTVVIITICAPTHTGSGCAVSTLPAMPAAVPRSTTTVEDPVTAWHASSPLAVAASATRPQPVTAYVLANVVPDPAVSVAHDGDIPPTCKTGAVGGEIVISGVTPTA
jgi:hypothetical protein